MPNEEKEIILRQIYYDAEYGFGSIYETYKQAVKLLPSVTLNDVKEFLAKQESRQLKPYMGFNSYVAHEPLQEIQIDLADFTKSAQAKNGFRYAFVAVDVFSKYMWAVPCKDKMPDESVRAFTEVLDQVGTPRQIYHDSEGAWNSAKFIKLLNGSGIKQIITSSPPPFVERNIQTLKHMIYERLEGLKINVEKWHELVKVVLKRYNDTVHSTTGLTPNEARKDENRIRVWLHIQKYARFRRKYPPLHVGDEVRTLIKPHTFKKGYQPSWSKGTYKITYVTGNRFLINDSDRKRVWNRHELLKVERSTTATDDAQ